MFRVIIYTYVVIYKLEKQSALTWRSPTNILASSPMAGTIKGIVALLLTWFNALLRRIVVFALLAGPIPNHIAFIMDGNRRFARKKNEPVAKGHDQGSQALRNVCRFHVL